MESVCFIIESNPKPLARSVIGRGARGSNQVWLRDPTSSREAKAAFRESVKTAVFGIREASILFDATSPIVVDITFFLKPPKDHFVNCDPALGRIKESALKKWPTKPDIDNLDKFVLDCLQGLLYSNDSQVVKQQIQKMYHHHPPFTGQTKVIIRQAEEHEFAP